MISPAQSIANLGNFGDWLKLATNPEGNPFTTAEEVGQLQNLSFDQTAMAQAVLKYVISSEGLDTSILDTWKWTPGTGYDGCLGEFAISKETDFNFNATFKKSPL